MDAEVVDEGSGGVDGDVDADADVIGVEVVGD